MINKNLQRKIIFTLLALIFYRIGTYIPIPVVDIEKISFFSKVSKTGILSLFNSFSGGSISRASIFSLGIMPYISSSIVIQLAISTNPTWKNMKKENPDLMQKKSMKYTRYLTLLVSFVQSFGVISFINKNNLLISSDISVILLAVLSLSCGTFTLIWLSDRITVKGITNGTSIIIFGGIVAEIPKDFSNLISNFKSGVLNSSDLFIIFGIFIILCCLVILVERSNRLVHIQYPHQAQTAGRNSQNLPNFMPIKVNPAGIIPPIFASSILSLFLILLSFLANYNNITNWVSINFGHGTILFATVQIFLIIAFSFFYNNISMNPKDIAEQLRKVNVFIPGIRPGEATVNLFQKIILRLSLIGGLYLSILGLVSEISFSKFGQLFMISGTSILIVINVITDIMIAIQTSSLPEKYQKIRKRYK